MALNFPSSPTDLQLYTDQNLIVWRYNELKGVWDIATSDITKQFSGAKLQLNDNKGLSNNLLPIEFDDYEFDTGNYYNFDEHPSRLNIIRTGYYRLNILLATSTQGTGASYGFSVRKNSTVVLTTDTAGANQYLYYDEIVLLYAGDYIEIYASDINSIGEVTTDSFFEIERVGIGLGTTTNRSIAFSGVRVELNTEVLMTSTPTSIEWDIAPININADVNGNLYWNVLSKENISIHTTGYYRIKGTIETNNLGGSNSYSINLRSAGSNLETATIGPNEKIDIDETYYVISGSIIDIQSSNTGSVGSLTTNSYIMVIRQGV